MQARVHAILIAAFVTVFVTVLAACSNTGARPPTSPPNPPPTNSPPAKTPQANTPPSGTNFVVQSLARVNAARSQARSCGERRYAAAPALSWDAKLEAAAATHTRDMIARNYFSHTGSDGSNVGARATRAGYTWASVGENIAAGYPNLDAVVKGWLESPGHCANLMNPNFTQFGLSSQTAPANAPYDTYWTMVLARPRN